VSSLVSHLLDVDSIEEPTTSVSDLIIRLATGSRVVKVIVVRLLRGLARIDPSRNTDQGALHCCEQLD
jgi:hypothetical protein